MYKIQLIKDPEGYYIQEYWVETNPEKYKSPSDDSDKETIVFLIAHGLLGLDICGLYSTKNLKSDGDVLSAWGMFGKMLFGGRDKD